MSETLKRKTMSAVFWKILEQGGGSLVQIVVQIVMARLLAPEQFGLLAIMLVFVNIGSVIVQSGLNTALIQASDADESDLSTVFWMSLVISIALYAIVFCAAPVIALFYEMNELVWPLRILALIMVFNSYNSVQMACVARSMEFKKVFYSTIASMFLSGTLGVTLAIAGFGIWALVAQQLSYQAVSCCVLALQVSWRPKLIFVPDRAKELFGFGWKLLVSGLLDKVYQSLSDLVIGKQFSVGELGLVSQGKKYPQAIGSMLDGAIQPVMLSAVARVQSDVGNVKRLLRRALKTSTFLIVPVMGMFALVAEPLISLLLGEQWISAAPFLQMYCFVYALLPIHTTNLQALNGMGRSDLFLRLEVIKKAYGLCILLFTAFVIGDIYAIIMGYVVSGIISSFVNAWPSKRVVGYAYVEQLRDIAPAFAMTLVSMISAWPLSFLDLPGIVIIFAQCVVVLALYLSLSKLFHVEAFAYMIATARDFMRSRRA